MGSSHGRAIRLPAPEEVTRAAARWSAAPANITPSVADMKHLPGRDRGASYEPSVAEAFGNLPSSPLYLSPAFLKVEPSSMYFRC